MRFLVHSRKFRILLFLLGILSLSFQSYGDSWSPSCGATYCLDTSHGFTLGNYNTIINWSSTIYYCDQCLTLYQDHISFIHTSIGSVSNPQSTFGIGSKNANITLSSIQPTSITIVTSKNPTSTPTFFYYNFTSGQPLYGINGGTKVAIGFVSLGGFAGCSAPCSAYNSTNGAIQVKGVTGFSQQISFQNLLDNNSAQCTNFINVTNGVTTSFTLLPILLVVLAAGSILATLGGIQLKGKMNVGAHGLELGPPVIMLMVGIALVIVIGIYLVANFQAAGLVAFGC